MPKKQERAAEVVAPLELRIMDALVRVPLDRVPRSAAVKCRRIWRRCETGPEGAASATGLVATGEVDPGDFEWAVKGPALQLLTQAVTRCGIELHAGRRLLFHAAAVANPETGATFVFVAPGGTGKSQFVLQMGVTVATGIPLCDVWQGGERGTALLLLAEDEIDEVHRRLDRIITELSPSHPKIAADLRAGLLIKSMTASNNLMTRAQHRGDVEATDYVDRLLMTVSGIPDLKLIVIDPASRFRGGNENSADDSTRFIEQLERLRHATGATVLVCHHANKASMNPTTGTRGQAATRGSSAMTDGVRWQLNLSQPTKEAKVGLDASKHYLSAELSKSNYGPPIDAEILIRKPNGYLTSLRASGVPVTLEDRVLQLIRDEAALGKSYSANQIENTFGGEGGSLKTGKNSVRKAINALLNAGKIRRNRGKLVAMPDKPINPPSAPGSIP